MKRYNVNEIFYTLQGEGMRAGRPSVFVRFSGCNLRCNEQEHGFDCDTEFTSGRMLTAQEILNEVRSVGHARACDWIVLTGGEPALQVDAELTHTFFLGGYNTQIETNGTKELNVDGLDWITCAPKSAMHTIRLKRCDELKIVRGYGQELPKLPDIQAEHYLISPAFDGEHLDMRALHWCIDLVKRSPGWRLSVQQHKLWRIR